MTSVLAENNNIKQRCFSLKYLSMLESFLFPNSISMLARYRSSFCGSSKPRKH